MKKSIQSKPIGKNSQQSKPAPKPVGKKIQPKPQQQLEDSEDDDFDSDLGDLDFGAESEQEEQQQPPPRQKNNKKNVTEVKEEIITKTNTTKKITQADIKTETTVTKTLPKNAKLAVSVAKLQPTTAMKRKNNEIKEEEVKVELSNKKQKLAPTQQSKSKATQQQKMEDLDDQEGDSDDSDDWAFDEDDEVDLGDFDDEDDDDEEDIKEELQKSKKSTTKAPKSELNKKTKVTPIGDSSDDNDDEEEEEEESIKVDDEELYGWKLNTAAEVANEADRRAQNKIHFEQLCAANDRAAELRKQRVRERQKVAKARRNIQRYNPDLRSKLAITQNYRPHMF